MVKCKKAVERLSPYVPGKPIDEVKRELGLDHVVKIASNENPYGASPKAVEAAKSATDEILFYPDASCHDLKAALANKLCVSEDSLLIGAGGDEVISMLSNTFLEADDEAITGEITFGQYACSVLAAGGIIKYVPMKDDGYDLDGVVAAITSKTKIIFIANPNNPTGKLFGDDAKTSLLDRVPNHILVVFDEAYQEFVENKAYSSSVPLVEKYENLCVLKTFSKIYGLASLRVGYCVMSSELVKLVDKLRNPFNVSIPAQKAAIAALSDDAFVQSVYKSNLEVKEYSYKALDEMGVTYVKSETNFIALDCPIDGLVAFDLLLKKGYIVRPNAFGMKDRLRISLGTMEQMKGFFEALKSVLGK